MPELEALAEVLSGSLDDVQKAMMSVENGFQVEMDGTPESLDEAMLAVGELINEAQHLRNAIAAQYRKLEEAEGEELACTHCSGEGTCTGGADPLGNCPDDAHRCHACGGSGNRRDQRIF